MKIEVKTKKKPSVPSVKTMGVKKKAKTPAVVAVKGKKAAIAKEGKKAIVSSTKEEAGKKETAKVTPIAKKEAVIEKVDVKPKKAKKGKKVKKAADAADAAKAGPKEKQMEDDKDRGTEGKKRKRRKSRKPKIRKPKVSVEVQEKAEEGENPTSIGKQKREIEGNDSGSPAKKQKVAEEKEPEPEEMEMNLTGDLYKIFCKRRDDLKDRVLYAKLEKFNLGYYAKPPALFDSAQHVRICTEKGLFYLEYKTKKEAEKQKVLLEHNSLIKSVNSMNKKSDDSETDSVITVHPRKLFIVNVPPRITRDMLVASFPTAQHVHNMPKTRCACLIYKTEEEAEDAFVASDNVMVKGVKLTVLYLSTRKAEELGRTKDKSKDKRNKKKKAWKKSMMARKKQMESE